ncbi:MULTISPECIES: hypothetical protein [Pseudomonas]|uniref:Uncharacterized protein n=4 Tax=Pseudomonas TaxID=286 RepID=A0A3G1DGN9_PSEAI|nr:MULTISPECIES: hypothetical protein [Pseudomonas]AXQ51162.1 hypothetical protein DZC31_31305 [Stenotrophomonas rhizophila]AMP35826.1 Hypothetical protein [Pseudomonas aeruginosa]ESW38615.1 hypothetical protein O164_17220 [Pseudomonas taiwanensis SJ9]KIC79795.1 hypothetical protein RR51_24725 [Pseudomonas sp. C5pp]MCE0755528.1 hypothetical protein [Pseudomonas asiatica]
MLTSQRQQGASSSAHLPAVSSSAVRWVSQVTVELSYWHGNQRLKNLDQFEWHGDAVMAPALAHAQSKCDFYQIDASSTLELWAFRSLWRVAKVQDSTDQHWSFADSLDHGVSKLLVSHHPVWSSKHGRISAPDTWPGFTAIFRKLISVDASRSIDGEMKSHVGASLRVIEQSHESLAVAITDGGIRGLTITRVGENPRSPGCDLFMVTGTIGVAVSPYQAELGLGQLEAAVRGSVEVEVSLVEGITAKGLLDAGQRATSWALKSL